MIVDTETGEVLNPRIIHSNSRIVSHAYSHNHTFQHNHVHSYVRSDRSYFSGIRRNSLSIFVLFVLILFFLNYFSALIGSNREFSFYSLLSYISNTDNFIDLNFFDEITTFYEEFGAKFLTALEYRIPSDSFFAFLNFVLEIVSIFFEIMFVVCQVFYFLCSCIMTLFSFVLSFITFIFG